MISVPRRIATALIACFLAIVAVGVAFWLMLDGQAVHVNTQLPTQAMTAPMIGVVVFWLACRALRIPLDAVRTFLFGAIVVYGTLYFFGRVIALNLVGVGPALVVAFAVIFGFAAMAVHRALVRVG